MKQIVDLPGQTFLWNDLGEAKRRPPTPAELEEALTWGAKVAVSKWHHGRAPLGMQFEDLKQEVVIRALKRLRNFTHGGSKTLKEFSYMSCYFALRDIQNETMRQPKEVQTYPLFEKQ